MRILTGKALSRRQVLRGAGAAIGLPLLESMSPAGRLRAATTGPVSRLACIYIPHGAVMREWTPPASTGTTLALSRTLASLAPFRDALTVVSGLTLPNAYGEDASAGANHQRSSAVWLTGVAPGPEPVPSMGVSADQVAARHIGQQTPLPSLEVSLEERSTISWSAPTVPLPMESNPQTLFTRLFGDGSTPQQRDTRRSMSRSLLDSIVEEIAMLNVGLPAGDRARLDRYLTSVREVERRIALASNQLSADLDVPEKPIGVPEDFEAHLSVMLELIALAWEADITRVTTMMIAQEVSNAVYPQSGITEPFHNLSHHSEVPAKIERLASLNAYHARTVVGGFLERLSQTPDGDRTLLDTAAVLYGSGMSNSNQHDHEPLPILVAGTANGRLSGGRHIRVDAGTPMSNLLVGLLRGLDIPLESFADSTGALEL